MIQFLPESCASLPSKGFVILQSDGFPLNTEADNFNRLIFSILSEVALMTLPSQLPISGDISAVDLVVANVESRHGNIGLQSSPVTELVRQKDHVGGLPEIYQLLNANADIVPVEDALGFKSNLSLLPNPHRIICGVTIPVASDKVPVYISLTEQDTMLTIKSMLSDEEY